MKARTFFRSLLLISSLGACRSSSDTPDARSGNTADARPGSADASTATKTTIAAMRQNNPVNFTVVELDNVVVVTQVTSKNSGHFYVQDQGGGQYSGIQIYCSFTSTSHPCTMTRNDIENLKAGDVVTVVGKFSPDSFNLPIGAIPTLEVIQPVTTKSGNTMAPVAVAVDASALPKDTVDASNPYLGSYVKVTGAAKLATSTITAAEYARTCTGSDGGTVDTFGGFEASDGTTTLDIGLNFYDTLYPSTGAQGPFISGCYNFDYTTPLQTTDSWTSISGIVESDYNFNDTSIPPYMQISPTLPSDFVP